MNSGIDDGAALVGRILLAILFIWSGWGKIEGFESTAGFMAAKGLPMAQALLVLTILVELGGGVLLAAGIKARWVALALALFTVAATLVFHAYWTSPPEQVMSQSINFYKNVSIIGGLLLLFGRGAGRFSLEKA